MTFDSVPESHTYKYSTFQAQNPGRFLSCMRKEMALLTFSLPAGIIVRGYEDRVVILCLFSKFFLSLSQSEQRRIFRTWSCRDGDQSCVKRERGFQSLKSRNTNVDSFGSTQGHWLAKKYRITFSANQNTNPKSIHVRLLRAFHALGSLFATLENTIIIFLSPRPPQKNLHNHCFQFLLGLRIVPRETENNSYAKLWGYKKIIMVFSKVANPRCSLEIRLVHSLVCVSWTYFPLCSIEVN